MTSLQRILVIGAALAVCAGGLPPAGCSNRTGTEETTMSRKKGSVPKGQNRLALEKSPYLLQHADNPVDWYPWGEEAFEKARLEDKPIFLSIGYSTCHWCHVMEHESFEDSTVARLMNDAFVNIKVDREERPDVDNVYMTICQMMTGGGGWPLTIIMTPDQKPFFAATYVPKESRFGRTGMVGLIPQIRTAWEERRSEVADAADKVTGHLSDYIGGREAGADLDSTQLHVAYKYFAAHFDKTNGGFRTAPKFPTPHNLLFLLRYWKRSGEAAALEMVEQTLDAMSRGGIYDHVGFGFHRYSTDDRWFAPHFEKMLYDQALLTMAYTEAYLATGHERHRRIAEEILAYVLRDMTDPSGGFYSAEDADSEGIEGKFYLWSQAQLRELLGGESAGWIGNLYGVQDKGNFAEEVEGGNILHLPRAVAAAAAEAGIDETDFRARLERVRAAMFEARRKRVHPHKDDKILTDWNGLMIAALAKAGRAFDEPRYVQAAGKAARFILDTLRDDRGRLLHRYRDGEAGIAGKVEDYAFFVWGLIELYENTFDAEYLRTALDLNGVLVDHFWDDKQGGFFFTADDAEALIVRTKEIYDGALPSGNSVAMLNLIRLGRMTAESAHEDRASGIGRAFYDEVSKAPAAFSFLLTALDFGVGPSFEVVIVGDPAADDTRAMDRALNSLYVPNKVVLLKPAGEGGSQISRIATFTESHAALEGKATAYVCRNYRCELPTTDVRTMLDLLAEPAK
ncbi:MAG: thioredoxin domain-containing protein [Candidatus Krumholzibacteriia bacterium]